MSSKKIDKSKRSSLKYSITAIVAAAVAAGGGYVAWQATRPKPRPTPTGTPTPEPTATPTPTQSITPTPSPTPSPSPNPTPTTTITPSPTPTPSPNPSPTPTPSPTTSPVEPTPTPSPYVQRNLAPDFTLVDLDGNTFSLSDFRGKVVLIDFMATWCGPCRQEMPHYEVVWNNYKDQIVLMSISIDPLSDTEEKLQSFKENFNAPWIWARDTDNVGDTYRISAIPTTVIIDQNGEIRFAYRGLTSSAKFIQNIEQLLAED